MGRPRRPQPPPYPHRRRTSASTPPTSIRSSSPNFTACAPTPASDWRKLAIAEHRAWVDHFGNASLFRDLVTQGAELSLAARVHRRWVGAAHFPRLLPASAITKVKAARAGLALRSRFRSEGLQPPPEPTPPAA
jgi:hypothetical protein